MPKTKISEFDTNPDNNTDINSINIAEGCPPSGINNAIRQLMADLKDLQAGTSGDTIPIAAGGTGSATASGARTALGLGTIATQDSNNVTITGGAVSGITDLAVSDGGTGSSTASGARANLGLVIGTDVQAYSAELQGIVQGGNIGMKNRIINGAMMIDQRNAGASVNAVGSGVFPVDRFIVGRDTSAAVIPTQRSTTATSGFVNSLQVTISTSATPASGDDNAIFHRIEGFNMADFGWGTANAQPVTISFWVRASVTGTYGLSFANSAANRCYVTSYTVNSANTFEYKTVTIAGDTSGTWLTDNGIGLRINWDLGCGSARSGSATNAWGSTFVVGLTGGIKLIQNSGATFYITGVQLEKGSTATSFDYRPYGTELALCQRYYWKSTFLASSTANVNAGNFPVTMRTTPSVSTLSVNGGSGAVYSANGADAFYQNVANSQTATATIETTGVEL